MRQPPFQIAIQLATILACWATGGLAQVASPLREETVRIAALQQPDDSA